VPEKLGGRTRARTWDPLIKSPKDQRPYQWVRRKPGQLGAIDFIYQLDSLQTLIPRPSRYRDVRYAGDALIRNILRIC
jgi:hypothetical protein